MSIRYELEVLRVENIVWNSRVHRRVPNLYVKVTLGEKIWRTRVIKRSITPIWKEKLPWSISDDSSEVDMTVELKHEALLGDNPCVGVVAVKLGSLIEQNTNDEVKLELRRSSRDALHSSQATGVMFLRLKNTSTMEAVQSRIEAAEQDVAQGRLVSSTVSAGVAKVENISSQLDAQKGLVDSVKQVLDKVEGFMSFMDKVVAIHPYVNVAWQVISSLYKAVRGQVEADQAVVELVRMVKEVFEVISTLEFLRDKLERLQKTVVEFITQSTECCLFIREYTRPGFMRRAGQTLFGGANEKINQFKGRFNEIKEALTVGTILQTAFVSARTGETVDLIFLRNELNPSEMSAADRPQCLLGTRVEVLNEILDWVFSETETNILWLHGVAGSGKSTISMTVAEYCLGMRRRGAYLFFVRGKCDPKAVIRTLAFWLASFDYSIGEHVVAAVKDNNNITAASLESQFEVLVAQPLRAAVDVMTGPVAVVLDALDECGAPGDRSKLLKLLGEEFMKLPFAFRFIITSRPETDIRKALSTPFVHAIELDYSSSTSQNDVFTYVRHEMRCIFDRADISVPSGWDDIMSLLGKTADGLFIWASTAVKLVSESDDPEGELKALAACCRPRDPDTRSSSGFSLDGLYNTVLLNSGIQWSKSESRERFSQVLGLILFGKTLVTPTTIDGMLGFSSHLILSRLTSVLTYTAGNRDAPVRLFHTSFSDYLLAPDRKGQSWFIDILAQRLFLATRCFGVMENGLCFNICDIESSFVRNDDVPDIQERVKDRIPSYLEYACCFWAEHLCDLLHSQASPELLNKLRTFTEHFLLYWLEVLSLAKHFKRFGTRSLYDVSLWCSLNLKDTSSFLWSAYRFASIFSLPILESVPHIYLSALSLGEEDFAVANHYARAHSVIRVHRFGTKPSQPCLKVFKGHTGCVRSVAFSPDGKRIVSGSKDKTIRVWDAESGEPVSGPFEGHTGDVNSVAFSPSGKHIASGSRDRTVRVWDVERGELICRPFEGHTDAVSSVAFCPDGRYVASGSHDKTIRIWDADSRKAVLALFEGHSSVVCSVAYSPDGKRLASISGDHTIRIWDALSGRLVLSPLDGRNCSVHAVSTEFLVLDPIYSIVFSSDGRRLASCSEDSIRVWNAESGELNLSPLDVQIHMCSSIAFSPDGKRLASGGCSAGWICVWDTETGERVFGPRSLGVDTRLVLSVVFSPDGKRIAFGADKTIRVWDVDGCEVGSGLIQEGHTGSIESISVSTDGKKFASGSSDGTICVWDTESGELVLGPLRGHTDRVNSVTFAPGGRKIVSGSDDRSICVWDAQSGELVSGLLEGHTDEVESVVLTLDGRYVVFSSSDGTIRIWDVESKEVVSDPLRAPRGYDFVRLSPDGKRVAGHPSFERSWSCESLSTGSSSTRSSSSGSSSSGSSLSMSCIWDVETGEVISGPFEGYVETFSPDGKHIVSCSDDKTIRILDTESGELVAGPVRGHTGRVHSVAATADGKFIVSEVVGRTIIVWDTETGEIFAGPFRGHTDYVQSCVLFSDGKRVASYSLDGTIRVWDTEYGRINSSATTAHSFGTEERAQSVEDPSSLYESDPELRIISSIPEVGKGPNWTISNDGWLLGKGGELLAWIPDEMRATLWQPSNTAVFGGQFSTKLDFSGCRLGEGWYEGYLREK